MDSIPQHSPADLQSRIDDFDRMFIARGQAMQQQRQQQMQAQQQPPQTQAQDPQAQQQQQQHPFQQPFSYELDEDYGELGEKLDSGAQKLREEFYGVLNTVAGSLLQQQQVVSQYQQQQYQAQQEQIANDFHEAIQSLGQKEMFGDKPFHELPADSQEARQLTVVWQQALAMANGLQAAGLQVPDLKTLVDQTFRATFPDKIEARIRADQNQKLLNSSRNRMGGGNRVAAPHGHVPPTQDDPVNDEKIKEAWELWSQ